jgi:nitrite reductase/ring-hydroxylating ferredoxin subunit
VAKVGDVEPGDVKAVKAAGMALALYNLDGTYYATEEICTHAYASLAEGFVFDDAIECPLHGARFSIKTGAVLSDPATEPLKTYPVRVEGEVILVGIPNS